MSKQRSKSVTVKPVSIRRLRRLLWSAQHWLTLPPTSNSDRYCVSELCKDILNTLRPKSKPAKKKAKKGGK